jgi:hypothetical protein
MKGEIWDSNRIKGEIGLILKSELYGLLSDEKINELIYKCDDDMSAMEFFLQKYKYHQEIDDEFKYDLYKTELEVFSNEGDVNNVLSNLSAFEFIGYSNEFSDRFKILCEGIILLDYDKVINIIDYFSKKEIILIKGDYLRLEEFRYFFFSRWLNKLKNDDLKNVITSIEKSGMAKSFSKAVVNYCDKIHASQFILELTKVGGLFHDFDFINTNSGSQLIFNLVELDNNVEILAAISKALENSSNDQLKNKFTEGRRHIVWALEKLVYRTETFNGAAILLFKLAVTENETISNNATFQFCQLYQLFLPATTVSLEERINLLKNLMNDATGEEKAVIIQALDRALMTRGFTRMGGADKQAGEKFEDYQPKTNDEILGYWQSVIELLEELNAYEILINKFNAQVHGGNANAMINSITKMIETTGSISKDLRQQFEYVINDQRELSPEIVDRVQSILDQYSSDTIREQLEYKVALAPYSSYKAEDGKIINKSEKKAIEFAANLSLSKDEKWLNEIDILLQNEQRFTFPFGKELAKQNSQFEKFIDAIIEKMASIPFEQQNNNLIVGYCSEIEDEAYKRSIIDRFLTNEKIAYHAIQLTRQLTIQSSDLIKLKKLIDKHPTYIVSLQYLRLKNISSKEVIEFIEWVKLKEPYGWWIAIDLIHNCVEKEEEIEASILETIESLLMKPGILKGENMHVPFAMHQYVELFKLLEFKSNNESLIEFLAKEIINASLEFSLNHEHYIKSILDILIENHWEITWGIIGQKIINQDYYGWYNLKDLLKTIRVFDDDNLMKWMEEFPMFAPQKAISFINLVSKNEGHDVWSPLVIRMFDKFYLNKAFLESLSNDLNSYSWVGSLVLLYENRINLLKQISQHDKKEISSFALKYIKYFEIEIERERKKNENDDLDF